MSRLKIGETSAKKLKEKLADIDKHRRKIDEIAKAVDVLAEGDDEETVGVWALTSLEKAVDNLEIVAENASRTILDILERTKAKKATS